LRHCASRRPRYVAGISIEGDGVIERRFVALMVNIAASAISS